MFIKIHRQYVYFMAEANVHESICGCYCKCCNELCYKTLVDNMFVTFSTVVIVNTATSYVIELYRKYILLFNGFLVISVIEHR